MTMLLGDTFLALLFPNLNIFGVIALGASIVFVIGLFFSLTRRLLLESFSIGDSEYPIFVILLAISWIVWIATSFLQDLLNLFSVTTWVIIVVIIMLLAAIFTPKR